jgi:glycosyltransferase involved in cell wall biosynthesis
MSANLSATPRTLVFVCNVAWFFVSHRLALAKEAKARGYEVHVASDIERPEEARAIEAAGLHFHRIRVRRGGVNPWADLVTLVQLARLFRRCRPSIVHNVTIKPVLYGSLAARWAGACAIVNAVSGLGYVFVDASRARGLRAMVHRVYRLALRPRSIRVIFQNQDDRDVFIRNGLVAADKTVLIAGSGVDLGAFSPTDPPPDRTVRIVLPARMLADKGVNEFVAAAVKLRDRGLAVECLLAGGLDSANPAGLSAEDMRRIESTGAVKWLGHVEDMVSLLRDVHIVCLPSYREGLPKALIEACAMARPIVTTDVAGCRDVVEHGANGLLVPAREAGALAEALAQLVQSRELREQMGRRAREIAVQKFDVKAVIDRTLALYDDAADVGDKS